MNKTVCISNVIQGSENHTHCSEIVEILKDANSWLKFDVSKRVVDWIDAEQKKLPAGNIILISNAVLVSFLYLNIDLISN